MATTFRFLALVRFGAWIALAPVLLAACGGGGGGGGGNQQPQMVTISGRITFDRIPFDATLDNGLDPSATFESPAREVTVQAIAASGGAVLAQTTTRDDGSYSLSVPANTRLFIRARAEMVKTGAAPTWNFSVRNNTNADALYALDSEVASSGTSNSVRDLNAPSGFGTNSYTGERAAAPFAILDTVFRAKELVLDAAPDTAFPALSLFWSETNRPTAGRFCPDDGDIGTTSYIVFSEGIQDDCTPPGSNADGIYILGDFAGGSGDTDEFDEPVIAHEFGHYLQDRFGRLDSIVGQHDSTIPLDLRVAFAEGWGNAFSGMVRGDPIYRDSQEGVGFDFQVDVETDDSRDTEGWFSEASVQQILWDLFDAANESGDATALGFPPIYSAMTSSHMLDTDALSSIYPFIVALRSEPGAPLDAIDDLLDGENIHVMDDFGGAESNDAGADDILPVYKLVMLGTPLTVCSRAPFGSADTNKLGNRVLLRFDNDTQRLVTITVNGETGGQAGAQPAQDPDIFVFRRGALAASGINVGDTETIEQVSLAAGTYIIEVYDFQLSGTVPRCMSVSLQGA